jgi:RimJ/RimL family protein N-acetyltransferase/predicted TPR repeat methyltransferase
MNREKIFKGFPTLETERLILRQLDTDDDAQILFDKLYNVPDIIKYDTNHVYEVGTGGFSIMPTMKSKMMSWEQMFWNKRIIVWGIELKSSGELIGIRFCEFFSMGIAYLECKLSKEYWRQGLMTEATTAIVNFLEFHDVRQIFTIINEKNLPALSLDKKIGFVEVDLDDMYFSQDIHPGEAIVLQGLIGTMERPDERIFVLPKINPLAFKYFEAASDARKQQDIRSCANYNIKALQLQPDFIHAKNGLAWAILDMGDPSKAIELFTQILKIKPKKYTALLGRAYAFSDIGDIDRAIQDFNDYLKLDPEDDDTFTLLGNTLFQVNRFREAIVAYDNAVRINPRNEIAKQNKVNASQMIR